MILKLETVLNPPFQEAFVALTNQPLPAVSAYRLAKVLKQFVREAAEFDAARLKSIEAHCSTPGDRSTLDAEAFRKDLVELLAEALEVEWTERVVLTDKMTLTAQQVALLEPFVTVLDASESDPAVPVATDRKIVPMSED
jgi:hypothetical protein